MFLFIWENKYAIFDSEIHVVLPFVVLLLQVDTRTRAFLVDTQTDIPDFEYS